MSRRHATVRRRDRANVVEVVRLAIGVMHLVRSARRPGDGNAADRRIVVFDRVLGGRQIAQAALVLRNPSPEAHTLSTIVDVMHAVSMLPLLLVAPRMRRFAAEQLCVSSLFATLEAGLVGAGGRSSTAAKRRAIRK